MEHRTRLFRAERLAVVALVIAYFFLPYDVQSWIPVGLPFLAAVALEVQFFVGGYLAAQHEHGPAPAPNRGPQTRDLLELGWEPEFEDDEFDSADDVVYDERRRWYARHLAEAVVAVAIVAGILFYASRPHGWNAVSDANRARAEAVFSREASTIAGHPASIVCDTSGTHVGVVQEARTREIDGHVFKYAAVAGIDRPRIVQVGYDATFLNELRSRIGVARLVDELVASGHLVAIRVVDRNLLTLAFRAVPGAGLEAA